MQLPDKSVLLISPAFFGYEISIKNALLENGYRVTFFDERTSNKPLFRAIFRVKKEILSTLINKYYRSLLDKIKDEKFEHFLLIKGEVIPEWFIVEFKKRNPCTTLIYYTYDSLNNNNNNSISILKHFDKCYSFDFEDVKNNPSLKLKHLFYSKEFINDLKIGREKVHTISFVGTLHSNRYTVIKNLFSNFENALAFYYLPAKWLLIFYKLSKKNYWSIKWREVSFNKLSRQQVANIFKSSKSVLDIQRSGQTGLTMRTFEVLAAGAVLVTTNPYIKLADFYCQDRVVILDDTNLPANITEIKNKVDALNIDSKPMVKVLDKYFINNWVNEFFE